MKTWVEFRSGYAILVNTGKHPDSKRAKREEQAKRRSERREKKVHKWDWWVN